MDTTAVINRTPTTPIQTDRRLRRPRDTYGLALSTTAEAAGLYNDAVGRILRVQQGAEALMRRAVEADPGFAMGYAGLAVLGHEFGALLDVADTIRTAERLAARGATDRERSHISVMSRRIQGSAPDGAKDLVEHIGAHPRDALAVSVAVPTIAFAGATEVPEEAWALVEGLAPAYGEDWWYAGLLAFIRTDQERWAEAAALADRALSIEPSSGHAVHARAHVHYETGDHADGLMWLDGWIADSGRTAHHRSHFSWHAGLHELALGDDVALRARYESQLAPPHAIGLRILVDSASLLWRAALEGAWEGSLPVEQVIEATNPELITRPPTPFAGLHAAVALAAASDASGLAQLARHASHRGPVFAEVVAPLAGGLGAFVEERYADAADALAPLAPSLVRLGGSAAQREVVEDTLLHALLGAGRLEQGRAVLERRLDRRPSRRDLGRLSRLGLVQPGH